MISDLAGRQMTNIWEEHKKLYHYTNWNGLSGILKTRSLWATHYRFLNDSSEFRLFRHKLISLLTSAVHDECRKLAWQESNAGRGAGHARDPSSFAADFAKILIDYYYRATEDEVYIASFCGKHKKSSHVDDNGLLSQWRAYGGFALVFDTLELWHLLEVEGRRFGSNGMHLSSCVYSYDEDVLRRELSEEIDTLAKSAKRFARLALSRKANEHNRTELYRESLWPFVFCCSRYKHCGFEEENEVRLVIKPAPLEAVKDGTRSIARQSRHKNGECIRYVSLFDSTGIEPAIEKIIVGPHKEQSARAAALRVMLGNRQIEVTCSDIPFVG